MAEILAKHEGQPKGGVKVPLHLRIGLRQPALGIKFDPVRQSLPSGFEVRASIA